MSDLTPNIVVQNPAVRKVANWVIGVALIVFPAAAVLEANAPAVDFSAWLVPATAVTSFLAGLFGLAVTTPNVPSRSLAIGDDTDDGGDLTDDGLTPEGTYVDEGDSGEDSGTQDADAYNAQGEPVSRGRYAE